MSTTATILITLLIIAVLILVHEWGHFIIARRIGIPVWEFSLGFGYRLFSVKRDGVVYSLRLVPLGGFVRMAGEEPGDEDDPNGFNNRTPWEKIKVSAAGPLMNMVLALFIFIYLYSFIGIAHSSNEAVIGKAITGKPAAAAGLQAGDRIVNVNGTAIKTWSELNRSIESNKPGVKMRIIVERKGKILNYTIVPGRNQTTGKAEIGVLGQVRYEKLGIIEGIKVGFKHTFDLTVLMLSGLGLLFSGGASLGDLAGPVGITKMVGEVAQIGWVVLLGFSAFLSINLGILNLLPIPALDGSKIVFALIEAVRRKPIEPEKEGFVHWLGFLFLIGLMIVVTFNDIARLLKG
ncbi:RIP metalloprotease RseP [Syntrophomonas palmitatica]|uniref:RIP metalloprotease RseP n=1 Tax=Syntrophomonas palmitatica TaxID=402877 RepID=UPI0006D24D49|nr:RIP metalloprotease RseP [Syntrophomonas palmitatica]